MSHRVPRADGLPADKPLSRQRLWQIEQRFKNCCMQCGKKPTATAKYCDACRKKQAARKCKLRSARIAEGICPYCAKPKPANDNSGRINCTKCLKRLASRRVKIVRPRQYRCSRCSGYGHNVTTCQNEAA